MYAHVEHRRGAGDSSRSLSSERQHPLVSKSPPSRCASANIQRCRWVFGMGSIKTIDRWLCPAAHPYDEEGRKMQSLKTCTETALCFRCWQRPKVTVNIHCCRWVGLCRKAHWTMSATVAQICPTLVSSNQQTGCERLRFPNSCTSCFSLLFSLLFLLGSESSGVGEEDRHTNRLLPARLSSSSSLLL